MTLDQLITRLIKMRDEQYCGDYEVWYDDCEIQGVKLSFDDYLKEQYVELLPVTNEQQETLK